MKLNGIRFTTVKTKYIFTGYIMYLYNLLPQDATKGTGLDNFKRGIEMMAKMEPPGQRAVCF